MKGLQIEGFRGINNQGDPLNLSFETNCVNSVFAANALGKSSIFEAVAFAIKGFVPKLQKLPDADNPSEYYANRFHGAGTATVVIRLQPDDGSQEVEIAITRDPAGNRFVASPSGCPNPEQLLRSLDTELALLDHDAFLEFVNDTPLKRGRTFSGLLGSSLLSEFRQVLEILSNRRNLNTDLGIDSLQSLKTREEQSAKEAENKLRTACRAFFSKEPDVTLDTAAIGRSAFDALKSTPIIAAAVSVSNFSELDFEAVRTAIKKAEASEERDRLSRVVRNMNVLEGLATTAGEETEKTELREAIERRIADLAETRGVLFHELYSAVKQLYDEQVWADPLTCPACESMLSEQLPQRIAVKLDQYKNADESQLLIYQCWKESFWSQRFKNLENAEAMDIPLLERRFAFFTAKFGGPAASISDLDSAVAALEVLENSRVTKLATLQTEKDELEKTLPPSLVALTQQVEHASRLHQAIKDLERSNQRAKEVTASLALRSAWADFIRAVSDEFGQAEVRFSTAKTSALENDYREMYEQVTNNPDIVPFLRKADNSEELHLRLAKFYGLSDLSAATLLPESYRNALAICIYLAAALSSTSTARFIILDDVTSSFDAGHQWSLMELIRTKIANPANPNGPQIIIFSHDGLLEKYFDTMDSEATWHHQRLQGAPPKGLVYPHTQDVNRLEIAARQQLSAGQTELAQPLVRQYLEQKLLQMIRKLEIPVPLDFSIREDRKMVGNCIDAISNSINLNKRAGTLILHATQLRDLENVYMPALVANWVSHYSTGTGASLSPYVFLGVLDTINKITNCFTYECKCSGAVQPRFYRNLSAKACKC
jgi:hypothetical protein